jgi:hypothetical protein
LTEHDHQEQGREKESDGVCGLSGVLAREENHLLEREHEEKELRLQQEQAVREQEEEELKQKHKRVRL